jgi:hypothetical protein
MNRPWRLAFVLGPLSLVHGMIACGSEDRRSPYLPGQPSGGRSSGSLGGRAEGGSPEGGESSSSGGRSNSNGGSEPVTTGGAETSGGSDGSGGSATSISVRVSEFEEDFTLSPLNFTRPGTAAGFSGGQWQEQPYPSAPVDLPPGATAYRFVPTDDKFMQTFTVAFPPRDLAAMGVLSRLGLSDMFAQLQVFDEPNVEQAQLVVFVHDQNGQPLDEVIPSVPGALDLAFYNLEIWDDLAEQTTGDGLFWAGNVSASEFLSGNYAFIVQLGESNFPVSVPMAVDSLTFVDLELPR